MTIEDDVGALIAMGFNRESAEDARAKCNTVEEAVEELMKSPKLISEESSKCDESPAIKSSGSHKGVPVIPVNPGEEVETRRSTGEWVKAIVKDVDNETVWVQYIVDDIIMKKALNYRSPSLRLIEEFQLMDEIEVYAEGDWVEGIVIGENEVAGKRMEIEIQFSVNNKTFRATLNRKSKLIAVRGTHIHKHMVEESSTPQLSKLQQAVNNSATLSPRVSIRNSAAPPSLEWPPLLTGADLIEANGGPLLHGDVFDCVDETGKWCPAEVIEVFENKLKIHFLNYSDKFDQWIDIEQESDRVAPFKANSDNPADPRFVPGELVQIRMGRDLLQAKILKVDGAQMFVSVLDPYGRRRRRWYHLHSRQIWLLERNDDQEGPNETGYEPGNILEWLDDTGKWDWVEVLQCSGKYALVTSDSTYQWVHVVKDQDRIKQLTKSDEEVRLKEETETFSIEIEEKFGLQVIPIPADGNCLFSAIAFLVYGDIAKNAKVRKDCFSYINIHRAFFDKFFSGEFEEYVNEFSQDGKWGGEPEIYALSELYNKRVEIYCQGMKSQPTITMNDEFSELGILRMSYHGNSHYNAVIDPKAHAPLGDSVMGQRSIRETRKLQQEERAKEVEMKIEDLAPDEEEKSNLSSSWRRSSLSIS